MSSVVWGVFALSECSMALEDEIVGEIHALTNQLALSDRRHMGFQVLAASVEKSAMALEIFQRHGWSHGAFVDNASMAPSNMLRICQQLRKAREEKLESALEIRNWRSFRCLAKATCGIFGRNKLMTLRLRILPSAELSGLGAIDIDGGNLIRRVLSVYSKTHRRQETDQDSPSSNVALQNQVHELNNLVLSQDRFLQSLAKRHQQWMPSLNSGPVLETDEDMPPELEQGEASRQRLYGDNSIGSSHLSESTGATGFRYAQHTGSAGSTSSGYLSGGAMTPPLTGLGVAANTIGRPHLQQRLSRGDGRGRGPGHEGSDVMAELSDRLMEVLQNQQRLFTALHPAASTPRTSSKGSRASSRGSEKEEGSIGRAELRL